MVGARSGTADEERRPLSAAAILSVAVGLAGLVLAGRPPWGLVAALLAVVLAVSALRRSREVRGTGWAGVGLVLGLVGVAVGVGWLVYLLLLAHAWSQLSGT